MRPGLFMVGRGGALLPANGRTQDDVRSLNLTYGDLVSVQIIRQRNPRICALANAVLARVSEGLGVPTQTLKTRLKMALGWTELVQLRDGTIAENPKRMSFDDLKDEDEFAEFWQAAEALVCGRLLPELEREEQEAVLAIMAGRHAAPKAARGKSRPR